MSASELSQIMREVGLSSGGGGSSGNNEKIHLEHVLVLTLSEATDKLCKGAVLTLLELGRHFVESFRILAIAGSVSVVLWGTGRFIESVRSRKGGRSDEGSK